MTWRTVIAGSVLLPPLAGGGRRGEARRKPPRRRLRPASPSLPSPAGGGGIATRSLEGRGRRPRRAGLLPPLVREKQLRGGVLLGPDRDVLAALELDEVGGGERVLPGLVELDAAIAHH